MFSVIIWVRVVLRKTVVGDWCFDDLSGSHLHLYTNLRNDSYMTSNETDIPQQTIDGSKITAKLQPTSHCNFHVLTTNHITTKLSDLNHDQKHKYHHLTTTLHLTLKMTTAQVVETSVSTNSLSKDYSRPDNHVKHITDTPGFKAFIKIKYPITCTWCITFH